MKYVKSFTLSALVAASAFSLFAQNEITETEGHLTSTKALVRKLGVANIQELPAIQVAKFKVYADNFYANLKSKINKQELKAARLAKQEKRRNRQLVKQARLREESYGKMATLVDQIETLNHNRFVKLVLRNPGLYDYPDAAPLLEAVDLKYQELDKPRNNAKSQMRKATDAQAKAIDWYYMNLEGKNYVINERGLREPVYKAHKPVYEINFKAPRKPGSNSVTVVRNPIIPYMPRYINAYALSPAAA